MKKLYAVLLLLFFFIENILAHHVAIGLPLLKGSLTGQVADAITRSPIRGASVYFLDLKVGSSTDASGHFSIKNLPEGKQLVEISHVGYTSILEYVDINAETRRDFAIAAAIVENNAVIVTGVGTSTQSKKTPFQVSVMHKDELVQSASSNIIEALAKKPGVSTLSTGPSISKPIIRGLGYNRVLTINDGVRQEGQQWGDEHGIEIDEASVNRVEVLRGPASLIYGSDATAGVINIITNVPIENNSIKANLFSNYQTNNKAATLNGNIAGNIKGINWNLYGSSVAAADYQNKYDGRVFNSKFNQKNWGGYLGYNGSWGYSHLLFSNFNLHSGLIEGERDALGYFVKPIADGGTARATEADFNATSPGVPYQHIRHFKIATDNNFQIGKNRLSLNIGFQHNQREEFANPDDANERALYFDLKTITYTARFNLADNNGWKTAIGLSGMQQHNTNNGLRQLIPNYHLFDMGGYLYTQKTFDKLTLSGGARYDTRNLNVSALMDGQQVKGAGFKKLFANFSGSIGAAIQLSEQVNVKLNAARGFRAPSIPELASNGSHDGTLRYEYGDAQLKSETSTQLDAGIEFSNRHITFSLSGFYNYFDNFILYRKLQATAGGDSTVSANGAALTAFKFDQRKAALAGLEFTMDIHPHPLDWLHIENTFSYVVGKLKTPIESASYLPFIPAPRWITELRGNFKKVNNSIHNFYVKMEADNTFAQNNIFYAYNTETASAGYTILNAGLGADFISSKGKTIFSLTLSGNNLADIAYQNHLSRLKYAAENLSTGRMGVYNMGRNFSVKLNIPFSYKVKIKLSDKSAR